VRVIGHDLAEGLGEKALVQAGDGLVDILFVGGDAALCVTIAAHGYERRRASHDSGMLFLVG
jgi:hypothetical protein